VFVYEKACVNVVCGRVTGTTRVHGTPGSGYASSVGRRLGQRDYRGGRNPRRETRRSAQRRRTRINISPLARDTSRLFLWRHLRPCTWSLTVTSSSSSYSSYRSSTYHLYALFSSTTYTHSPLPTPPHSRAHTYHPSVSTTSPPVTATSKLPNSMYTTYVTYNTPSEAAFFKFKVVKVGWKCVKYFFSPLFLNNLSGYTNC